MGRVSVVMPVHNADPFLDESIASVLGQSFTDLELICVDDASSDSSGDIIEAWRVRDSRVRAMSTPGGGPGLARNIGLDLACGEYLAFVDADDIVPPTALEAMVHSLDLTGSDIVCGRVMRISSNDMWPSFNHVKAIPDLRLGTHIVRAHSLLYDTTAWNKVFRRSFWDLYPLRYPEGQLYEDVCLMARAHWEARAVDLLPDVVYYWRRRDDGNLSITQGFMDPANFRDRIASIRRVQGHLEQAPASLRDAAYFKALRHDLAPYLCELPLADRAFAELFVELVGSLLEEVPCRVLRRLPPLLALEYHLAQRRATDQLLQIVDPTSRSQHEIPELDGRWRPHLRVPDGPVQISRRETDVARRLPLICGVDRLTWKGDDLVIEGYAAIAAMSFDRPTAGIRRLKFTDPDGHQSFSIWLRPRKSPEVDARRGRAEVSYRWSGFTACVPADRLKPSPGRREAQWSVTVQVAVPGAAKGSTLGPPVSGPARYSAPHLTTDGYQLACRWADGQRLQIRTRRAPLVASSVTLVVNDDLVTTPKVRISLRAEQSTPCPSSVIISNPRHTKHHRVVIRWSSTTSGEHRGEFELPVELLAGLLGDRPYLTMGIEACGGGYSGGIPAEFTVEHPLPCGKDVLLVRPNRLGDLEMVLVPPRVVIARSAVDDGNLIVHGEIFPGSTANPQFELRNGIGQRIVGEVEREGAEIAVRFQLLHPVDMDTRCIPAGWWRLVWGEADTCQSAQAVRGRFDDVERRIDIGEMSAALHVDDSGSIGLQVYTVKFPLRGPNNQVICRKRHYEPTRRRPVADLVLFESWAGKSATDNPGALLAAAIRLGSTSDLVISINDASVPTPDGVRRVVRWTPEYYRALGSARLIIANDPMPSVFAKRTGQKFLQTWHGTPLKRIGFDVQASDVRQRAYQKSLSSDIAGWDWLLSPNSHSTEVLRSAFRFGGPIWETGYPRNDALVGLAGTLTRDRIRRRLGIQSDATVVLWTPTWRDDLYGRAGGYALPGLLDLEALASALPSGYHFLIRAHHLVTQGLARMLGQGGPILNVSQYPDVNDLYLASDVLVTDYSSAMFDYAVTRRPIVLFVPDLQRYRDVLRGLYLELEEVAPGPMARSGGELVELLSDLPAVERASASRYAGFRARFCAYEDGHSADRVWHLLSTECPRGS